MFAQIIEGTVAGADRLRTQTEAWHRELRPQAKGYLGATMGISADGIFVAVVRFDSTEAAAANSRLSGQSSWWRETAPCFRSAPTFEDCPEVDVFGQGGSPRAGFVQIVRGRARDKRELKQIEWDILEWFPTLRPDYFGSWMAWYKDRFTEAAYFESTEAAHEGERRVAESDHASDFDRWLNGITETRYIDLTDPWNYG